MRAFSPTKPWPMSSFGLPKSQKQMDFKDYLIDLGRFVPAFSGHILEEIG
jgi:hypothetical protein